MDDEVRPLRGHVRSRMWVPVSHGLYKPRRDVDVLAAGVCGRVKDAEGRQDRLYPRDVVGAIELSRATYSKMIQNLVWATGYNLVAIPVAAGLLVPWGIDLPMAVGAIAMSVSTIVVAANAQLLRRLRLRRDSVGSRLQPAAA